MPLKRKKTKLFVVGRYKKQEGVSKEQQKFSFLSRRDVVIVREDREVRKFFSGDSYQSGITSADLGGSSDYSSESERESKWRRVS